MKEGMLVNDSARFVVAGLVVLIVSVPSLRVFAAKADENAAPLYRQASAEVVPIPEQLAPAAREVFIGGWQGEQKELEALLMKHKDAITKFKEASQLEACQFVVEAPPTIDANSKFPDYMKEGALVKYVILDGKWQESKGEWGGAIEDYLAVLRFAGHVGQQQHFILFHRLMESYFLRAFALPSLEQVINRDEVGTKDLRTLLDALLLLQQQAPNFEAMLEEEEAIARNNLHLLEAETAAKGVLHGLLFRQMYEDACTIQGELHEPLLGALQANNLATYEKRLSEIVKRETHPLTRIRRLLQGKCCPAPVSWFELPSRYTKAITYFYLTESELRCLIAATALNLYAREHGGAPETLESLVPMYLSVLPEDPFNDFKPLKYERKEKGWVVYSIGPDRADNHGTERYNENGPSKTGDIVVAVF